MHETMHETTYTKTNQIPTATTAASAMAATALAIALALLTSCKDSSNDGEPAVATPTVGGAPAFTYDFTPLDALALGGKWKTEGVVVLHGGKVVYEKYAAGFDAQKRHITYSVSKSIGSALVGIAIADGLMKLEDSVCAHVPAPAGADPTYCDTKVDHLVRMTSGLGWTETYDDPTTSNVLPMLYGDEGDMGEYAARRPRVAKAGESWRYSSGDANLLARALRGALQGRDMRAWAREKLFVPAGITSAVFESDRSGTLVFSSSCFMTTRDMARFGQLYLDDGMSEGKRVLPSSWVKYTSTPAPPVARATARTAGSAPGESGGSYGGSFWLNAVSATASADTFAYPEMPADAYSAEGHWGQKIFVVPSRGLVVARVGNDRDPVFDAGPMVGAAVTAVDAASKGTKP